MKASSTFKSQPTIAVKPAAKGNDDMSLSAKRNGLDPAQLYSTARRQTGSEDFGDPQIATRLTVLTASIEREANLHRMGRFLIRNYLSQLLKTRLLLEQSWKGAKSNGDGAVRAPIFITGIPRSGSTFLHELLAADPGNRTLAAWEMLEPLGSNAALRKWKTGFSLWVFRRLARGADAVHPLRANSPHECVSLHSYTLLSREFGTMLRVPTYDAFLDEVDFSPAYAWQKRFMQRLQPDGAARRWVLKAPDHSLSLAALFKVFPDAIVIQTHREPMQVVKSATRLTFVVRKAFSNDVDVEEVARGEAAALEDKISKISKFREARPDLKDRFVDVGYKQLTSDPVRMVEQIYERVGLPMTESARRQVSQLALQRGKYSQRGLTRQLRETNADELIDPRQFAGYSGA